MGYIFDTSFILSLYIIEDENHNKAVDLFSKLPENTMFYINELTYIELLTVINYKKGFLDVKNIKSLIHDLGAFFVNSGNFEYIKYFEYFGKKISIVDISIIYDSIKYNCDILSFDKELMNLYKKVK